jgi:hypothetical protein
MLKLDKDIEPMLARHCYQQVQKSSMLENVNYNKSKIEGFNSGENKEVTLKGKVQSSSHNDYVDSNIDTVKEWFVPQESCFYDPEVRILGFHPYKEIIFMCKAVENKRPLGGSMEKGLAYHLSTSSVEDLGNICPTNYLDFTYYPKQGIKYSFIYTPCWLGEFPRNS